MGSDGGTIAPLGVAGTLIITSKTLPAAIKMSVCTRGAAGMVVAPATCTPGTVLPSSAIKVNPLTVAVAEPDPLKPVVSELTMEGTCIRRPAFTRRAKTVPVSPVVTGAVAPAGTPAYAANTEAAALVILNARPLMR